MYILNIKISMTCVFKENEVNMKMVQEQWLQLKIKFLLGYNMKIAIYWGEINLRWMGIKIWGRGVYWVALFQVGRMSKFLASEGTTPSPSRENPVQGNKSQSSSHLGHFHSSFSPFIGPCLILYKTLKQN